MRALLIAIALLVGATGLSRAQPAPAGPTPHAGAKPGGARVTPVARKPDVAATPHGWSFAGPIGSYDRASAQRGFAVFQQACSGCHGLGRFTYADLGGIGLADDQIVAIAGSVTVPGPPDASGLATLRPATPADPFRQPYPNEAAARAANAGALPGDLGTLVTGPVAASRLQALLLGYRQTPPGTTLLPGLAFNAAWPGHVIAMPAVLKDGALTFADGATSTVPEMAHDVATFLAYVADPHREWRERLGVQLLIFFGILTFVVWVAHRRLWATRP